MTEMATPIGKTQDMENLFKRDVEYLELMKPQKPLLGFEDKVIKLYE